MSQAALRPLRTPPLSVAGDPSIETSGAALPPLSVGIPLISPEAQMDSSGKPSSGKVGSPVPDDDPDEMVYCGFDIGQLTPTWQFIVLSSSVFFFYFAYSIGQVRCGPWSLTRWCLR